jgi:hypothetical protein
MVTKSIVLVLLSPPPNKPRITEEQEAKLDLATVKSPKSCAFPVVDIVIKSIVF